MKTIYLRPQNLSQALEALSSHGHQSRLLAGGTDLLVALRRDGDPPKIVIDISALKELRSIGKQDGFVTLGALVTHRDVELDKGNLKSLAPVLAAACQQVGSMQIRNRGTLGGSCANASPAGDPISALYVLDAEILISSKTDERWVPVTQFFSSPGQTILKSNEMITFIRFRPFERGEQGFFSKIGQRRAVFCSKVCVASSILMDGKIVRRMRLALGAVAPTVIRAAAAENFIAGKTLTTQVAEETSRLAVEAARPIEDLRSTTAYRRHVTGVLVRRGLEQLIFK